MYGGIVSPVIKEQIDYAIAVEKVLNERVEKYKHDRLNALSISPDANTGIVNWDDVATVEDQMKILSIQNETMVQAFVSLAEKHKINPLTLFVPPIFFNGMYNNLEKLHIYGNAYDKILLMNWKYFRCHFIHTRKFMFSTQEYMKILLDAINSEKLISLCKRANDFIQNYDLTENLLKYKDTGLLYGGQIQFEMTVLTEFITQCLDRQDMELIRATMTVIHQQLVQYP